MESTACGLLKTRQACYQPWTNWMSVQQHQFRHRTFPPCTHHSRGEMEVTDIPTLKLRVERGIS